MDLHHLTATQARDLFGRRELSPVELLDAVTTRLKEAEPAINAVTEQWVEESYVAAREAEARFASGPEPRPLDGVPLMLKDEQPIAGRLAEDGCVLERGRIADETHPIVDRIRAAGAVIHGRTTTPEFCCAAVTHTHLWGVSRNPWNLEMTPGGSSGGSGAALAAGSTMLATGSDIGGSIRIPAAYCGVVGFKPPFGRVPGLAPFNSDTFCADGPMGRSVADVAMLQNVLAGPWVRDQASLRPKLEVSGSAGPLRDRRIALCITLGDYDVDPAVVANTRAVASALRAADAIVTEVELPWTKAQVMATAWPHYGGVMGPLIESVTDGLPERAEQLMPYTRAFAARAAASGDALVGVIAEAEFYRPLGEILDANDALICPTIADTGIPADAPCSDPDEVFSTLMTLPFNIVGRVPVLAVPSGVAPSGVPTGVQIVGRTYDDGTVFEIGAALEQELGLWTDPGWWPTLAPAEPNEARA